MTFGRFQAFILIGIYRGDIRNRSDIRRLYFQMERDTEARYEYIRFKPDEKGRWVRCCIWAVLKCLRKHNWVVEDRSKPAWERVENELVLTERGREVAELLNAALNEGRMEVMKNNVVVEENWAEEIEAISEIVV